MTLFYWLVSMLPLGVLMGLVLSQQKQVLWDNLASMADGVASSLHSVAAQAALSDDLTGFISHGSERLRLDPTLDYILFARTNGQWLFLDRSGWRADTQPAQGRLGAEQVVRGGVGGTPAVARRVSQGSRPVDCAGTRCGWIHVGLSLADYDRGLTRGVRSVGFAVLVCTVLSVAAAVVSDGWTQRVYSGDGQCGSRLPTC